MANSVNTNYGATVALQSLNRTNRELDIVQKRVSTGFRVSDAKDDGASFAVAQGLRADVKGNEAVNERLSVAKGLVAVTQEGLKGISDALGDLKKVLVKLADDSLGPEQIDQYINDGNALAGDVMKYISQSTFGGKNLLTSTTSINVISDANGGVITLPAVDLPAALAVFSSTPGGNGAQSIRDNFINPGGSWDVMEKVINDQLAAIGASARTIENQDNFVKILGDTINNAIGSIVDADLAKESARLQALQIRQQLGTQTLSIANQSPSILLSLFQ